MPQVLQRISHLGLWSQMVGGDVWSPHVETSHCVVKFTDHSMLGFGTPVRQIQKVDCQVWGTIHPQIQVQEWQKQVRWFEGIKGNRAPCSWFMLLLQFVFVFKCASKSCLSISLQNNCYQIIYKWYPCIVDDFLVGIHFGESIKTYVESLHFWKPRSYPPSFGLKMAKLYNRFLASKPFVFGIAMNPEMPNLGMDLFAQMSWDEVDWWNDANMESVFRYLRASKSLRLGSYRSLFPTEI